MSEPEPEPIVIQDVERAIRHRAEADRPEGHQFYKITVKTFYLFDSYTSRPSRKYQLKWA